MNAKIWNDRGLHIGLIDPELAFYRPWFSNWAGKLPGEVIKDGRDIFCFNSFDPVLKEGRRYFTVKIPDNFEAEVTMEDGNVVTKTVTVDDLRADGIKINTDPEFTTDSGTTIPERHTLNVIVSYRYEAPDVRIKHDGEIKKYTRTGEGNTIPVEYLDDLALNNIIIGLRFGKKGGPNNNRACYLESFYGEIVSNPIQRLINERVKAADEHE